MAVEPKPRQKRSFFISYSRRDRIIVRLLFDRLEARHYRLWMDTDESGIEVGEKWRDKLISAMTDSEAVIACVSSDFLKSPYCKQEIEQAIQENKKVYPVIVHPLAEGESLAQFGLDDVQYVDLVDDFDTGFARLTAALPEPASLRRVRAQQIGIGISAIAAVALIIIAISNLIPQPAPIIPTQIITPAAPTATPSIANADLAAVITRFLPDETLSDSQRAFTDRLVKRMAERVSEVIASESGNSAEVGVLALDWLPPVGDMTTADMLARQNGYHVVIYGEATAASDGSLVLTPHVYIPPNRFSAAPEMTGDQLLGDPLVLTSTEDVEQTIQTSSALQDRLHTLVTILSAIGSYIDEDYQGALRKFALAQAEVASESDRNLLIYLQGNTYLRMARKDIQECLAESVREHLQRAEEQYELLNLSTDAGDPKNARPYIGLAEVLMLRSTWQRATEHICEPRDFDPTLAYQAIEFADLALDAQDFHALPTPLRAEALLTHARAYATRWFDPQGVGTISDFDQAKESASDVIAIYESNRGDLAIRRAAFEAYMLRGVMNLARYGDATSALSDLEVALAIPGIANGRKMFANDFAGLASEELDENEAAETYYRRAYELAPDYLNRDIYACEVIRITGDENAANVSGDCTEILEEAG